MQKKGTALRLSKKERQAKRKRKRKSRGQSRLYRRGQKPSSKEDGRRHRRLREGRKGRQAEERERRQKLSTARPYHKSVPNYFVAPIYPSVHAVLGISVFFMLAGASGRYRRYIRETKTSGENTGGSTGSGGGPGMLWNLCAFVLYLVLLGGGGTMARHRPKRRNREASKPRFTQPRLLHSGAPAKSDEAQRPWRCCESILRCVCVCVIKDKIIIKETSLLVQG